MESTNGTNGLLIIWGLVLLACLIDILLTNKKKK